MNHNKHVYYITVGDIQRFSVERTGRSLDSSELKRVIDILLDRIQWLDILEEAIDSEIPNAVPDITDHA